MAPLLRLNLSSKKGSEQGFLMLELLVSIAIASVLLGAFITLVMHATKAGTVNAQELGAELYLRELIEIAKDLEQDPTWAQLNHSCTQAAPCHAVISSNAWTLVNGPETVSSGTTSYQRSFYTETVNTQTKRVEAQIKWPATNPTHTRTMQTYVFNPSL
jgi:type II secretory pathway pseudopilin PulG